MRGGTYEEFYGENDLERAVLKAAIAAKSSNDGRFVCRCGDAEDEVNDIFEWLGLKPPPKTFRRLIDQVARMEAASGGDAR